MNIHTQENTENVSYQFTGVPPVVFSSLLFFSLTGFRHNLINHALFSDIAGNEDYHMISRNTSFTSSILFDLVRRLTYLNVSKICPSFFGLLICPFIFITIETPQMRLNFVKSHRNYNLSQLQLIGSHRTM